MLLGHETSVAGISGHLRGHDHERDLSFLDVGCATDLSEAGDALLFPEAWIGGGPRYSIFLRKGTEGKPVRLGEGWGSDLSGDGKWTLSYPVDPPMSLTITPTGPGSPRTIDLPGFEAIGGASWLQDETRILLRGSQTGGVQGLPDRAAGRAD